MLKKIKNIVSNTDRYHYKKFGSDKSTKLLENIKEAQVIFSHLDETGTETKARFVGGCVRKHLSNEKIDDIDIATILGSTEIKEKFNNTNFKVVDTGLKHGTVTLVSESFKLELTTLRKDIKTDGRHAEVEYIDNWQQDSERRDFTINSIYLDIKGKIFDPQNGTIDLKNNIVKFINSDKKRPISVPMNNK